MSFSAVLFLVLLSGPADDFLNRRLNSLFAFSVAIFVLISAGVFLTHLADPLTGFLRAPLLWWLALAVMPVCYLIQWALPFRPAYGSIKPKALRIFMVNL